MKRNSYDATENPIEAIQCPSADALVSFANGILDGDRSEWIGRHLEDCSKCIQTLEVQENRRIDNVAVEYQNSAFRNEQQLNSALDSIRAIAFNKDPNSGGEGSCFANHKEHHFPGDSEIDALAEIEICERLDQGGMGVIYKGIHTRLGKTVAIKGLPLESDHTAESIARFEREAQAIGRLDHQNIVRAMDARRIGNARFLIMEFVDGVDLHELVFQQGHLSIQDACEVIYQTSLGLQHAHENNVIHRDVKPRNIMVSRQGLVKVLDLGLARFQNDSTTDGSITVNSQILGTLDYLSPEQASDEFEIDHRSDVYSLGCTFYFLLSGQSPFAERTTPVKKMMAHAQSKPAPIDGLRKDVPKKLAECIDKMLMKSPLARQNSAAEIAAAVDPFREGSNLARLLQNESLSSEKSTKPATKDALVGKPPHKKILPKGSLSFPVTRILTWLTFFGVVVALGVAAHFKLANGTLLVKGDDSVAIQLENQEVTLLDKTRNEKYILTIGEASMRPGDYQIVVQNEKTGLSFTTNQFTIVRNQKTVVEVKLASATTNQVQDAPIPQYENPEREIAEWALGIGASGIYLDEPGASLAFVRNRFELPDSFNILRLDLRHLQTLKDEDLLRLQQLSSLRSIIISDTKITDQGFRNLAKISTLNSLDLGLCQNFTANGIRQLQKLPKFERLLAMNCPLGEEELKAISQLKSLRWLAISGPNVHDEWLSHFAALANLESLEIVPPIANQLTGRGVKHLVGCKKLRLLGIASNQLSWEGIEEISKLRGLEELVLSPSNMDVELFQPLSQLKKLKRLVLTEAKITDAAGHLFSNFARLDTLDISQCKQLTDQALVPISKMGQLRRLIIRGAQISDSGLALLHKSKWLKFIDVSNTNASLEGVRNLRIALPTCEVVSSYPLR